MDGGETGWVFSISSIVSVFTGIGYPWRPLSVRAMYPRSPGTVAIAPLFHQRGFEQEPLQTSRVCHGLVHRLPGGNSSVRRQCGCRHRVVSLCSTGCSPFPLWDPPMCFYHWLYSSPLHLRLCISPRIRIRAGEDQFLYHVINQVVSLVLIFVGLFLIKIENTDYQKEMLYANWELKNTNEEILSQRLELALRAEKLEEQTAPAGGTELGENRYLFSVVSHDLKTPIYGLRNLFQRRCTRTIFRGHEDLCAGDTERPGTIPPGWWRTCCNGPRARCRGTRWIRNWWMWRNSSTM